MRRKALPLSDFSSLLRPLRSRSHTAWCCRAVYIYCLGGTRFPGSLAEEVHFYPLNFAFSGRGRALLPPPLLGYYPPHY